MTGDISLARYLLVSQYLPKCQSGLARKGGRSTKVLKKNKFSQVVLSGAGQVTVWPKVPDWRGQEERPENTFKTLKYCQVLESNCQSGLAGRKNREGKGLET